VILTCNDKIIFNIVSDESRIRGYSFVERIPEASATSIASLHPRTIKEKEWDSYQWFGERRAEQRAYEEAYGLGYGNYVLTLLSLDTDDDD
jgi:hypothetical protein